MKDDKQQLAKAVHENLSRVFQAYQLEDAAPENLKEAVFQTIDTITLASDFIDLFTSKFIQAEGDFLEGFSELSQQSTPTKT